MYTIETADTLIWLKTPFDCMSENGKSHDNLHYIANVRNLCYL